jgi:CBS domain-containing protein
MTLSVILARKGRETISASPDDTLHDIARMLSEKGIGAVLITAPDRALLGIISERDIVRAIARNGAGALDEKVDAHMTSRVVTATAETSVAEAMSHMTSGRFRHIPVMQGDKVDGLVSIGDLVKHRLSEMESENKALFEYITAA